MATDDSLEIDPTSVEGVLELLKKAAPAPGFIDLWCVEVRDWGKFAGALSAIMLRATEGNNRTVILKRIVFVVSEDFERIHTFSSSLRTELIAVLQDQGAPLDLAEEWARGVTVAITPATSHGLVGAFKGLGSRTLVVVLGSSAFTSDDLPDVNSTVQREADLWIPGFLRISGEIDATLKSDELMFAIAITGRPTTANTGTLLRSISGTVLTASLTEQGEHGEHVALAVERALALAKSGAKHEALAGIDKLNLENLESASVKAQILIANNDAPLAFAHLTPYVDQILASKRATPLLLLAKAAQWHDATLSERAIRLVLTLIDPSLLVLVTALELSSSLEADDLENEVLRELLRRFPRSEIGLRQAVIPLVEDNDFTEALTILRGEASPAGQYLAQFVNAAASAQTDWAGFVQSVAQGGLTSASLATADVVRLLLKRGEITLAAQLVIGCKWDKQREPIALGLARRILLTLRNAPARDDDSYFFATLRWSIKTLARRTEDQSSRSALSRLLSTDSVGLVGTLFLLSELATSRPFSTFTETSQAVPMDLESVKRLLETDDPDAVGLLGSRSVKIDANDAPAACEAVLTLLEYFGESGEDNERAILVYGDLGLSVANRFLDTCSQLTILRAMTSALCGCRAYQTARNIAERALFLASGQEEPLASRIAFGIYSDVWVRSGDLSEALLNLVIARSIPVEAAPLRHYYAEETLRIRILRNAGLFEDARKALDDLVAALPPDLRGGANGRRHTLLRLTMEAGDLLHSEHTSENAAMLSNLALLDFVWVRQSPA